MCRSLFDKLGNFFLQKFEKWQNVIFEPSNVETVSFSGFLEIFCSKVSGFEGEGGLFQNLFNDYIFCFLGHLAGRQLFELFPPETNLKKKSVCVDISRKVRRYNLIWNFKPFPNFQT